VENLVPNVKNNYSYGIRVEPMYGFEP